jgi:hypothetical protein
MTEILPGNGLRSSLTADATKWPTGGEYRAVICQDPSNGPYELVYVTGGQGTDTLTVTRAVESYNGDQTARAWSTGASISAVITQNSLKNAAGLTFPLAAPDGSAAAPSYAFASNPATGIYSNGTAVGISTGGTFRAFFGASISFNAPLQFSSDNAYDIGANSSARPRNLYVGSSAAIAGNLNVSSASSFSGLVTFNANLTTDSVLSTGSQLALGSGNSADWLIITTGALVAATDNTVDIGSTGANKPRNIYLAGTVTAGANFIGSSAYVGRVGTQASQDLLLTTNNTDQWKVQNNGHFTAVTDNTLDIGQSAAGRPRYLYAGSGVITPVVGTPLVQSSTILQLGTSNNPKWRIHTTGDVWAENDNTNDIGASGGSRPRDLYLGRNLNTVGTTQHTGNVGIGVAPVAYSGLYFQPTLSGANQFAFYAPLTFSTTGTGNTFAVYTLPTYAASTRTVAAGASFYADSPSLGAGVTVTGMYGLYVANQGGTGRTTSNGIYIASQSGSTNNYAIRTNGPVNVFGGRTNFGGTDQGDQHYFILFATTPAPTTGFGGMLYGDQTGLRIEYWGNSLGNGSVTGLFAAVLGGNTSKTTFANGIQIGNPGNQGAGIGTSTGLRIDNVVSGSDNNYEIWLGVPSGSTGDNKSIVFGNSGEYIRNPKNAVNNLSIESSDGYVFSASKNGAFLTGNAYWDGTNWQRFDVSIAGAYLSVSNAAMVYATAAAGANPITETSVFTVTNAGNLTMPGTANVGALNSSGGVFVATTLTMQQNHSIIWTDGNSAFMSYGRAMYFDEYAGGWNWRDTSRGSAAAMTLSGGGLLTVTNLTVTTGGYIYIGTAGMTNVTARSQQAWQMNTGNGDFVLGGGASRLYMHPNLTVYVEQGYPTFNVVGFTGILCNGVTTNSSKRYKRDIKVIPDALNMVMDPEVEGTHYLYNPPEAVEVDVPKYGLIAEPWERIAPDVVTYDKEGLPSSMDYQQVTTILFQAFKEYVTKADTRILELETQVKELEKKA